MTSTVTPHPTSPTSRNAHRLSASPDLPILDISYKENPTRCGLCVWLVSLGEVFPSFSGVVASPIWSHVQRDDATQTELLFQVTRGLWNLPH